MVFESATSLPDQLAEHKISEIVNTLQTIVSDDLGFVINGYINTLIEKLKLNPETHISSFGLYIAMMSTFTIFRNPDAILVIRNSIPAILDRIGKNPKIYMKNR